MTSNDMRPSQGGSGHPATGAGARWPRRRVLGAGLAGLTAVTAAGAGGLVLISRGALPGKQLLDRLDGACRVDGPPLTYSQPGPSVSGSFHSRARRQQVSYTIAYPPGHRRGDTLPLIMGLHAFGRDHTRILTGLTMAQALALRVNGRPLPPMAMAAADGGKGYWNPHPGDNPMAMVIDEFIPMCQRLGLGRAPRSIGTLGISMGGYGAILLAEKFPHLIAAVAALGPAIWTSYAQARSVNPGAYTSAAAFAAADVVTHARALAPVAVRVASGLDDPFHPGVVALAKVLPPGADVAISKGCHSAPFFMSQEPAAMAFLGRHIAA